MDPFVVGIIGVVVLLGLLAVGVHIGIALAGVGMFGLMILIGPQAAVSTVTTGAFYFATDPQFIVIPTFTIMGLVAMYGGVSDVAFNILSKWLGRLPGGLGIAAVAGCTAFGTVCGSSLVTAVVFAKVSSPEMRKHGYDKRFAYGIVATAGIIGILIPPSSMAVVYGLMTQESIGGILMAGIGPGLILAVMYTIGIIVMVRLNPKLAPFTAIRYSWKERITSTKGLWPVIVIAIVIIGGIYGGVFTAAEAASFGTLVIILIAFLWGHMRWKMFSSALSETVSMMAMIFLILIAARVFSRFMTVSGVAQHMVALIMNMHPTSLQLIFGIVVMYLILGCFLDSISMLCITIPLIYPTVKAMGIEPMWFSMIVMMSIEAGLVTPPVGMNVFGVKAVAEPDVSLGDVFRGAFPFLIMTVIGIVLVIFIPAIANWIPLHMLG